MTLLQKKMLQYQPGSEATRIVILHLKRACPELSLIAPSKDGTVGLLMSVTNVSHQLKISGDIMLLETIVIHLFTHSQFDHCYTFICYFQVYHNRFYLHTVLNN